MLIQLLEELQNKNIELSFSDGKLKFSGPKENITEDLLTRIKENKAKLIKHFWPAKSTNLLPINTAGHKTPFVMVHGELADYYISNVLEGDRQFYSFMHVGSDGGHIKLRSVKEFVENYLESIKIVLTNGPYLLGGYSFGGIIAYEMACKLQAEGKDVPFLVLFDVVPPNYNTFVYEKEDIKFNTFKFSIIIEYFNKYYHKVFFKSRRFFWKYLTLLPVPIKPKLRKTIIIDIYSSLLRKYKPQHKFKGKIILYIASENPRPVENYHQWLNFCDEIEIITLKGTHESIMKNQESINKLQNTLKEKLELLNI